MKPAQWYAPGHSLLGYLVSRWECYSLDFKQSSLAKHDLSHVDIKLLRPRFTRNGVMDVTDSTTPLHMVKPIRTDGKTMDVGKR